MYSLLKQAKTLGAFKTAKHAVTLLQNLKTPTQFQESVDLAALNIRAQPYQDAEDLLPLCYRCSMTNPLYNPRGNCCIHCGENFIFSFISFGQFSLFTLFFWSINFKFMLIFNRDSTVGRVLCGRRDTIRRGSPADKNRTS